jgi:MoxR-like ATPase
MDIQEQGTAVAASSRGEQFRARLQAVEKEISTVIVGQEDMVASMICTMLARGHLLFEGVPGLAKSLAVVTFARTIRGVFNRIQFTPDKLPGDITGTTVYEEPTASFVFHKGPVFCNILLADEINRAAPKVQSALLEAMQEKEVSIDRERYPLPELFMVLATQNPVEQLGTYPLSEAQLDRFMVKVEITYPDKEQEAILFKKKRLDFEALKKAVRPILDTGEAVEIQDYVAKVVAISDPVINYILELCRRTRPEEQGHSEWADKFVLVGASPRAGEHLMAYCKSYAFMHGRDYVTFTDVDECAGKVLGHRIILKDVALIEGIKATEIIRQTILATPPYAIPDQ